MWLALFDNVDNLRVADGVLTQQKMVLGSNMYFFFDACSVSRFFCQLESENSCMCILVAPVGQGRS